LSVPFTFAQAGFVLTRSQLRFADAEPAAVRFWPAAAGVQSALPHTRSLPDVTTISSGPVITHAAPVVAIVAVNAAGVPAAKVRAAGFTETVRSDAAQGVVAAGVVLAVDVPVGETDTDGLVPVGVGVTEGLAEPVAAAAPEPGVPFFDVFDVVSPPSLERVIASTTTATRTNAIDARRHQYAAGGNGPSGLCTEDLGYLTTVSGG
jgi:hypothetical protein